MDRRGFEVHIPVDATAEVTYAAQRLADYFPYYQARAGTPAVNVPPAPVVTTAITGDKAVVIFELDASLTQPQRIAMHEEGRILTVTGRTPMDVKAATGMEKRKPALTLRAARVISRHANMRTVWIIAISKELVPVSSRTDSAVLNVWCVSPAEKFSIRMRTCPSFADVMSASRYSILPG